MIIPCYNMITDSSFLIKYNVYNRKTFSATIFHLIFLISSASRETSPHRVMNASRHITSSLETSPTSSRTASPLPQDTDGEEEIFIDTVEVRY